MLALPVTDRLYYNDPTLLEFDARIVETNRQKKQWSTVLDRSAFYPTSGGQLHDTGFLNDIPVIDVTEHSDGSVLHITAESPWEAGQSVHGVVDSMRRLRNRQSHTAQHILSQAFIQICEAETVSVHLGEEYCSIELDRAELSEQQITESVTMANQIILSNLPVTILFVSPEEATKLPLRKIPSREGTIRVINIGDFDYSACGGTHCRNSAEVRFIHLLRTDKLRGHILVSFLAGETALFDFSRLTALTHQMSTDLTCGIEEMPTRVNRLISEGKENRATIALLQSELLPHRLASLTGKAKQEGNLTYITEQLSDTDIKTARALASNLSQSINGIAILWTKESLLLAVCPELSLNASAMVKEIATQTGLRGGGSDRLAQLGGVTSQQFADLSAKLVTMAANDAAR